MKYKGYEIFAVNTNGRWFYVILNSKAVALKTEQGNDGWSNREYAIQDGQGFVDGLVK